MGLLSAVGSGFVSGFLTPYLGTTRVGVAAIGATVGATAEGINEVASGQSLDATKIGMNAAIGAAAGFAPWSRGAVWNSSKYSTWAAQGNVRRDILNNPAASLGTAIGFGSAAGSEVGGNQLSDCTCQ